MTTTPIPLLSETQVQRFLSRIAKPAEYDACWEWRGKKHFGGYGLIKLGRREYLAHRVMWTLHHGEIPPGLLVCHHCDHPSCVRPEHLFLGTNRDNTLDAVQKGRITPPVNPHRYRYPSGADHPNAKLNADTVCLIRRWYLRRDQEFGAIALGRRFRVMPSTIQAIVAKKTWRIV